VAHRTQLPAVARTPPIVLQYNEHMEHNIFETQPEWIQQDDRRHRHELVWSPGKPDPSLAYNINPEFMYHRHRVMLPPELIRGKTVLDVGSCMGATGAWCLSEGAAHYTGIEPLERYARPSEQLFRRYHQADRYDIRCCSLEQFQADRQHDIVVASGVLYAVLDTQSFLKRIASLTRGTVIFDTVHPFNGYRRLFPTATPEERVKMSQMLSITQVSERIRMQGEMEGASVRITASMVSLQALIILMSELGFQYYPELYSRAEKEIPHYYDIRQHIRFMAEFRYVGQAKKEPVFKKFTDYKKVGDIT